MVDGFPMSELGDLGVAGKLVFPTFQKYRPCTETSFGSRDAGPRTEAAGMFPMSRGHFLIVILA